MTIVALEIERPKRDSKPLKVFDHSVDESGLPRPRTTADEYMLAQFVKEEADGVR